VIVVFVPKNGSLYLGRRCPPFAEELDYVPCDGDQVMFYKNENRHPVATKDNSALYGRRAVWTVTGNPLLVIPDLNAVVVEVQIGYRTDQDKAMESLRRAAIALDLPETSIDLSEAAEEEEP
jgi:hypothetical protein